MKVTLSPRPCLKHAAELDCGHGQPSKKLLAAGKKWGLALKHHKYSNSCKEVMQNSGGTRK